VQPCQVPPERIEKCHFVGAAERRGHHGTDRADIVGPLAEDDNHQAMMAR